MSRLKPFKHYHDTGIWWIGKVPAHWRCAKTKRFAALRSGHTPSRSKPEYWVDCTIPWFSLADVWQLREQRNIFLGDTKEKISELGLANSAADLLPAGTVVLSRTASVGFSGIMPRPMATTQDFVNWVPGPELSSKYLLYVLRCMGPVFESLKTGSTHKTIYVPDVLGFSTPLPPPEEQAQIATFLDYETAKIDALIDKQRQLIALLNEKRQAVISHAVTKGLNPDAPMRDSGIEWLGKVPAHWEEYPLKALFSLKHGYAFDGASFSDSGEFVLMTPGNFQEQGGFRPKTPEKFYAGREFPRDFVLRAGELLVAMTEQAPGLLGSALFVPEGGTYLHNQRLGLVRGLDRDRLNERFLFHLFNTPRYRAEVSISATGAKVRHTSPSKMLSIKVWIPPVAEQRGIVEHIDFQLGKLETLEVKAAEGIALLQERRAALISAAVTGKIDVRNWQAPDVAPEAAAAADVA